LGRSEIHAYFDPKSGLPANNDLASVSVVHAQSALADAYSTAMMAMGSERAIELTNKLGLSVLLMVIKDDNIQIIKINLE
jgi:thiamine biosynthesis lipoprotein